MCQYFSDFSENKDFPVPYLKLSLAMIIITLETSLTANPVSHPLIAIRATGYDTFSH